MERDQCRVINFAPYLLFCPSQSISPLERRNTFVGDGSPQDKQQLLNSGTHTAVKGATGVCAQDVGKG
jgi:hypothetical protein